MGKVSVDLEVEHPAQRWTCCARTPTARGRTVDDVADDLLAGELRAAELEGGRGSGLSPVSA